jgi:phosphate starvation-inducible PhoH-like protein
LRRSRAFDTVGKSFAKELRLSHGILTSPPSDLNADVVIEFPDNRLMVDLYGEHSRNLTHIESMLGVRIADRGNQLVVSGETKAQARAVAVLKSLYARLEAGKDLESGDIDRELRMPPAGGNSPISTVPDGAGDSKQFEMLSGGKIEIKTRKKLIEPRTDAQKDYVRALFAKEMAFGIGPAGTGKTYLAVAVGVSMFLSGEVDKIILSRPAVEAGERLGFLPGDMKDKVDPYMQPLYDALNDFLPGKELARMLDDQRIEIAPLAFMRGRTLSNAFVVLDEAQNATAMQMKRFLTRLGNGSRMVITGDRSQVDLPRGVTSGLSEAERLLKPIDKISFSYFSAKDVVRHPLVAAIIGAYEADEPIG